MNEWLGGRRITVALAGTAVLAGVSLAGCGDDGSGSVVTTAPPDDVVRVSLQEWAVLPAINTAGAGVIQFSVDNRGTEVHEFVLLRDGEELGEIEGINPGRLEDMRFQLKAGTYELACLIKETEANGEVEDHYALGMHTEFTVR